MLNRKVSVLTALLIGVISLIGGVFLTSLALRSYLRSAAPVAPVANAPQERTVALSSQGGVRIGSPDPITSVSGDAAQEPAASLAVETPSLMVQEKAVSSSAPQVAPSPVRRVQARAVPPRHASAEGRDEWKRGKEDKDDEKEKRESKKRGKGKKHGRGGNDDKKDDD